MGTNGPIGLDLNVALSVLRLQRVRPMAQLEMLDDLAIMEAAWLDEFRGMT
jgi:hypothetical protein